MRSKLIGIPGPCIARSVTVPSSSPDVALTEKEEFAKDATVCCASPIACSEGLPPLHNTRTSSEPGGKFRNSLTVGVAADVGGASRRPLAAVAQQRDRSFGGTGIAIRADDVDPVGREPHRRRLADALTGSGDNRHVSRHDVAPRITLGSR